MARGGNDKKMGTLAELVAMDPQTQGIEYITNDDDARRAIKKLRQEKSLGFDIETADIRGDGVHNGVIRTIQLGPTPEERYVFDLFSLPQSSRAIMSLLRRSDQRHVIHSASYEQRWLWYHYGVKIGNLFDTEKAAKLLREVEGDPKAPANLAAVLERELGIELDKTEQSSHWGREELTLSQVVYAADDVSHLNRLADIQEARLKEHGLWDKFQTHNSLLYSNILKSIHDKSRYKDDDWQRVRSMVERAHGIKQLRAIEQQLPQIVLAHHHRNRARRTIAARLSK